MNYDLISYLTQTEPATVVFLFAKNYDDIWHVDRMFSWNAGSLRFDLRLTYFIIRPLVFGELFLLQQLPVCVGWSTSGRHITFH